ncbi:MAG: ABC transporter substrate-binding protein [Gammaproteobacteria bacterium]|nr:ABC transporter substrate-binding protein [Gammaproteobacteria bacterium]MDH5800701.1 ABC transporter substrate-binding protein [Gammaproteobacteria bacterium]
MPKRLVFTLCLLIVFSSCAEKAPDAPIRLGTNVWPGYAPLYLASELNGWPEKNIQLIEYPSASEVLRAFRNKTLEAASLTMDEVLLLREVNIPAKVILIHDISEGADVILAKPEIKSVTDLKNKRVGVEAGALGAVMITRALETHKMWLGDIQVVNIPVNQHADAFMSGKIDAVVTFEPVRTQLLKQDAKEIFTSKMIPGEIVDVLVVHQNIISDQPEKLHTIVNDWFAALGYMKLDQQDAHRRLSKRLAIKPGEVSASYEGLTLPDAVVNRQFLNKNSGNLSTTAKHLHDVMLDHKLLRWEIPLESLYTDRFIP